MDDLRENIKLEMKAREWSDYKLSEESGVPQSTIHRYLSGKHKNITSENVTKLAKGLRISEMSLRFRKTNQELIPLDAYEESSPLIDDEVNVKELREVELAGGDGRHQVIETQGKFIRFKRSDLKKWRVQPDMAACVKVSGNSMWPAYPDGCMVGIDTSKTEIVDGDHYAIDHNGYLRVKIIYKMPSGGLRLSSFNKEEWPDEPISPDEKASIRVIGRVFWSSGFR